MELQPRQFNVENSSIREAYELLGAKTPFDLELSNKYSDAEQPLFISQEWDYDNPDQIQNKIKVILESVSPETLTEDERECRQEILWFWYHHATSCAIWKKDRAKAIEYSEKALAFQNDGHPNKITKILNLLVNNNVKEAEEFVKTVETDREEAEDLIVKYKEGVFFDMSGFGRFIEKTKEQAPKELLVKALEFVNEKKEALDLGAGALNDTRYLLEQGFEHVTAVDKTNAGEDVLEKFPKDKLEYANTSFEEFDFPQNKFDLVSAQRSLFFVGPKNFQEVFKRIVDSMKDGGVMTGQFMGKNDGWAIYKSVTSHTAEEAQELFKDFEILFFQEEEKDYPPVLGGEVKHWHVFHFIVRK